jgi:hypothetical protein
MSKKTFLGAILLALILSIYFFTFNTRSQINRVSDFTIFYASARSFFEGKDIYSPVQLDKFANNPDASGSERQWEILPNLNPPFQTLLILPLGWVEYSKAYWLWSLLSVISGLAAVRLIYGARRKHFSGKAWNFWLAVIFFFYFPSYTTVNLGQFSLFIFFLLVLAWSLTRQEKDLIAGILFGLLLSLKVFTGLFLLYFLLKKRWRLLGWYLGSFAFLSLLALAVFGSGTYLNYFSALKTVDWQATSWNASIFGFMTRIFGGSGNVPLINSPTLGSVMAYLACAVLVTIYSFQIYSDKNRERTTSFDLEFSLTLVLVLLLSPLGWMYYFVFLFLSAVILWQTAEIQGHSTIKPLIILAWILSSSPHNLIYPQDLQGSLSIFTTAGGFYFYALVIFLCLTIFVKQRSSQISAAHRRKELVITFTDTRKNTSI